MAAVRNGFAIIAVFCLVAIFQNLLVSVRRGDGLDLLDFALIIIWIIPIMLSIYSADLVDKVVKYPGSIETIDRKIEKLKNKLP